MAVDTDESNISHPVQDAQAQSEPALLQEYNGEITLRIAELPALKPRVLPTRSRSRLKRFIEAGQIRTFTLTTNFYVEVEGEALPPGLAGRIVIPPVANTVHGEKDEESSLDNSRALKSSGENTTNVFDGASIPLPWLVSYLSFGVLRPLGILLSASVVHDFAYQFGYLPVVKNGKRKHVPVQRHDADELFRLITQTLNGSNFFSRLAWHAVRLGWWGIKYAGQRFTGEPPIRSSILAVASVLGTYALAVAVRNSLLADVQNNLIVAATLFGLVGIPVAIIYLWIGIESRFRLPGYNKDAAESDNVPLNKP